MHVCMHNMYYNGRSQCFCNFGIFLGFFSGTFSDSNSVCIVCPKRERMYKYSLEPNEPFEIRMFLSPSVQIVVGRFTKSET